MNITERFRYDVEIEREQLMRQLGLGEAEKYVRYIAADEERACKWRNGKEIKEAFVSSNGKVVSLTTGLQEAPQQRPMNTSASYDTGSISKGTNTPPTPPCEILTRSYLCHRSTPATPQHREGSP
ncbi:hypothetical protein HOY80DRAFT_1134077 [Tuber brumale]|nr:hypothetical protein HOY80DRAFT_1134077 [Tuber brumale]